jgi:spore coat polysaccharide biosynthesis protein SpsF (cytidylyltransferase family)
MAKAVDQVILSTSDHPDDAVLTDLAQSHGFSHFRGSQDDKLLRYKDTAKAFGLDAVIVVDGDDPFCFPECIDQIAAELRKKDVDCVYVSGLPLGAAATGLTLAALNKVLLIKDENDTEVWGGYFIGSGKFATRKLEIHDPLLRHPEIRLTLDYQEDYELVLAVVREFNGRTDFTSYELMDLLVHRKPDLKLINQQAQERYQRHLSKAAAVKFKSEEVKR